MLVCGMQTPYKIGHSNITNILTPLDYPLFIGVWGGLDVRAEIF